MVHPTRGPVIRKYLVKTALHCRKESPLYHGGEGMQMVHPTRGPVIRKYLVKTALHCRKESLRTTGVKECRWYKKET